MSKEKVILVERETYEKNGNTYFSYFIKGEIRGKDMRIAIVPPDKGGYTVLDIVFNDTLAAELTIKPFEIKGEDGKVISGNTYAVMSHDEDGTAYECPIKPFRVSDKTLVNMLVTKKK